MVHGDLSPYTPWVLAVSCPVIPCSSVWCWTRRRHDNLALCRPAELFQHLLAISDEPYLRIACCEEKLIVIHVLEWNAKRFVRSRIERVGAIRRL
eukprot:COSAG05_NODE_605_length_8387_cov_1.754947_6_plen_95_part_00